MNCEIHHKSIVAIGGFNPMILTPDFLREKCSFRSEHEPKSSADSPVLRDIRFGNTEFVADLSRFQAMVRGSQDYAKPYPLEVVIAYLDVLKYTPISALGINFQYSLRDADCDSVERLLREPFGIGAWLGVSPVSISFMAKRPNGSDLVVAVAEITSVITNDITNRTKFTIAPEGLTVNNNFEVDRLDKDRGRLRLLDSNYSHLIEHNELLIGKIAEIEKHGC